MQFKRLGVITEDELLYKRILLLTHGEFDCKQIRSLSELSSLDLCIFDTRTNRIKCPDGAIRIGEGEELSLPVSLPRLARRLHAAKDRAGQRIFIDTDSSSAVLDGEKIRLTDTELRLLSALLKADGYVSRAGLLREVFCGAENGGLINVYIHYLREKLEVRGERIILSSRNLGYKIDERFKVGYADDN